MPYVDPLLCIVHLVVGVPCRTSTVHWFFARVISKSLWGNQDRRHCNRMNMMEWLQKSRRVSVSVCSIAQ
ncbi:unnamed protein product [Periconia digitata]|uniref:Uncharacterized protein n=1 Tax=Periconia digitata TaxID=1303443 RepID=A0A9W4U1A5_9PLEO|nr:unnamed protein product [Periconia digitata]